MTHHSDRREFLRSVAVANASVALPQRLFSAAKKSALVFTKASGFEHAVVKRSGNQLSIVENVVTELGKKNGFDANCSKDGRIFDSTEFHSYSATFFFTTGDLTQSGTDGNPPMSPAGKQKLISADEQGLGFVGSHSTNGTFRTNAHPVDV